VEPVVFLKTLKRMEGVWTNEEIAACALKKHEASLAYIRSNLQEPESYLQRFGPALEEIRAYGNSLKTNK
jgi:hypothetical protein